MLEPALTLALERLVFDQRLRGGEWGEGHRLDIDGLRAVAVLCVLIFHAFPVLLPGGFVGVDVFFVISGYLISGIIFRSLATDTFRFSEFYAHRVRRIFPALLLVLASCQLAGSQFLFADEFAALAKHVVAGSLFLSNYVLWSEVGYFSQNSELKVLLHLWSLAVEEQFYLVWPILLWSAFVCKGTGRLIGALFIASFVLNLYQTANSAVAAFYSPFTRFWELSLGGLLAWAQINRPTIRAQFAAAPLAEMAAMMGIGLILYAAVSLDRHATFPGLLALLPALGATLVIWAAAAGGVNRRFLSHPLLVWTGMISYPLYLWHWPIFSFARQLSGSELSPAVATVLLGVSFILAWLTFFLVERPIRKEFSAGKVAWISLALMAFIAISGLLVYQKEGMKGRIVRLRGDGAQFLAENRAQLKWFEPSADCIREFGLEAEARLAGPALFCSKSPILKEPLVAIIGDSTANQLFPGMAQVYARRDESVVNIGNGTCAPFRGLKGHHPWNRACEQVNRKVYAYLLGNSHVKIVIMSIAPWDIQNMEIPGLRASEPTVQDRFAAIRPLVARDVQALVDAGKMVVVTFDTPIVRGGPERCFHDPVRCTASAASVDAALQPYVSEWKRLFETMPEVCIFEQNPLFRLPSGNYQITREGISMFRDDHHLSFYGSSQVAQLFAASSCFK